MLSRRETSTVICGGAVAVLVILVVRGYNNNNHDDHHNGATQQQSLSSSRLWDKLFEIIVLLGGQSIAQPLLGFSFYFFLCGIFTFLDLTGCCHRFKIQGEKRVTLSQVGNVLVQTVWAGACVAIPIHLFGPYLTTMPTTTTTTTVLPQLPQSPPPPPAMLRVAFEVVVCWMLFDYGYWTWHVLHHRVKSLFARVHSKHHEVTAPFSLTTQFVHPEELFATAVLSAVQPVLIRAHPLVGWIWMFVSIYVSVDAHCGYAFPWSLHNWLPLYGGARAHDFHHMKPTTNFEPFFTYLDRCAGTAAA